MTGPAARPMSLLSELCESASTTLSFGTNSYRNGFHDDCWTTTPIPTRNTTTNSHFGVRSAPPGSATKPSRAVIASIQICETIIMVR
jgi:hypothetical protein